MCIKHQLKVNLQKKDGLETKVGLKTSEATDLQKSFHVCNELKISEVFVNVFSKKKKKVFVTRRQEYDMRSTEKLLALGHEFADVTLTQLNLT